MKSKTKHSLTLFSVVLVIAAIGLGMYTYFRIFTNQQIRESACLQAIADKLETGTKPELIFQDELLKLQVLVERSLVARSTALEVSNRVARDKSKPLSSADLFTLKSGTEAYLNIRSELYNIANTYECATEVNSATLSTYGVEPELRLKSLMLSLSAALTLYDNYMLGIVLFEKDDRLRKVVNDPDSGFGVIANRLAQATLAANSVEVRHRARQAIDF